MGRAQRTGCAYDDCRGADRKDSDARACEPESQGDPPCFLPPQLLKRTEFRCATTLRKDPTYEPLTIDSLPARPPQATRPTSTASPAAGPTCRQPHAPLRRSPTS